MGRTTILVKLNERSTAVPPSDLAGNCKDFTPPAGFVVPAVVEGIVGKARHWDGTLRGLEAKETTAGQHATRLRRDMAIEAIVLVPYATTNGTYILAQRGKGGSAAERKLWGLKVVVTGAPGAPVTSIQMLWQRSGGADATVDAVTFTPPAGWWYVAASRRWVSATSVIVDYFVNGLSVGQVSSAHGDIEDGDDGTVLIGNDASAGAPTGFKLDDLRVSNTVRTAEEIRRTYREMFVYPQRGYELVKAFLPPGRSYSTDPDSFIQRELMVEGDALGLAWSHADELLEEFLPDRATRTLERWEKVVGIAPAPGDSYATRRLRVLTHLRTVQGFSVEKVKETLAPILGLSAANVQIVENTNRLGPEDFADALTAEWVQEPNTGSITIVSGEGVFAFGIGNDARWTGTERKAVSMRTALAEADKALITAKLSARTLSTNGDRCGVFMLDFATLDHVAFGVIRDSGTNKFFTERRIAGVLTRVIYASPAVPGGDFWLLLEHTAGGSSSQFRCRYGNTAYGSSTFITVDEFALGIGARQGWAGPFIASNDASPAAASSAEVDDVLVICPNALHVFQWYVFRDPGLGGTPDLVGAQVVVDRIKPAHTRGSVCQTTSAKYDDASSLYDRDPMGA